MSAGWQASLVLEGNQTQGVSAAVPWLRRAWRQQRARAAQLQRGGRILGGSAAEDVTRCVVA